MTSGGVSPGLTCSSSAAAPATTGAATDVPLNSISVLFGAWAAPGTFASCGYVVTSRFQVLRWPKMSADSAPTMRLPGATRSGFSRLSIQGPSGNKVRPRVGPRELKPATVSSLRMAVACRFTAPTVMTEGSWPGEPTAP